MSQKPISPLRARMIQDMTVRNFAEKTKNDYKPEHPCPSCGGRMQIIEMFEAGAIPRHRPSPATHPPAIDTS
jgi:hypothetical protein